MARYNGPATVIADGAEYEVVAALVSTVQSVPVPGHQPMKGLTEWHGTLETQDGAAAWNIHQAAQARLHIEGSEQEGEFIAISGAAESTSIEIRGSGTVPFGD